jgi:hypothetical protein
LAALLLILGTAILSAVAVGALAKSPPTSALAIPAVTPAATMPPTAVAGVLTGPLDGLPTGRGKATRRPIVAMLDNFAAARPQTGLGNASVVWEAPVEGGITRLMAIYLERDASRLGPIRSARPYFLDWAAAYHPLFVHDGGSPAAQHEVVGIQGLVNVDAARSGTTFHRDPGRTPPHNLYTSTQAIRTLAGLRGETGQTTAPLLHGTPRTPPVHPTASRAIIDFATPAGTLLSPYEVEYRYDPGSNSYVRSVGGQPTVDSLTGRQIRAANVVILHMKMRPIPNDPLSRIQIHTTGSGGGMVLQGGRQTSVKWSKPSRGSALRLQASSSRSAVRLFPGTTWYEVVGPGKRSVHVQ